MVKIETKPADAEELVKDRLKELNKNKSKILGLKGKDLIASSKRKFTYPFIFKGDNKLKKEYNTLIITI